MKTSDAAVSIYHPARHLSRPLLDLELVFVLDGELEILKGRERWRLKQPDILLFNPPLSNFQRVTADTLTIRPLKGDCFFMLLSIEPFFLSNVFDGAVPHFECDSSRQDKDFGPLRGIAAELASDGEAGSQKIIFYSRLYRLLDELRTRFTAPSDEAVNEGGGDEKRRRAIYSYIRKRYRSPIGLEALSEYLSLSPQYLSGYFKKLFGVNFHTYLQRFRLESALKDLAAGDEPVTAVAYNNGFPNLTAFSKEMREALGQTPAEYRKARRLARGTRPGSSPGEDEEEKTIEPCLVRDKLEPFIGERAAAPGKRVTLTVDSRSGAALGIIPFEKPWQEIINLGFARDFEKSEFMDQVRLIQNEAPFRYARFQGIFGKTMLASKGAEYSFSRIDRLIDFLSSAALIPFIELGFKPDKINRDSDTFVFGSDNETRVIPIDDFEKLLASFLKHAINRYGIQEVSRWRFERWVPTDEALRISDEQITAYVSEFIRVKKTIKEIVPAALVGGPGFNAARDQDIEALRKILRALKEADSFPDFISFYLFGYSEKNIKGSDKVLDGILQGKDEVSQKIDWIEERAALSRPDGNKSSKNMFFATEWNIDYSCRDMLHDSLLKAPFILQNAIDAVGRVQALSYWLASDLSAEYSDSDAPLFGGAGLVSRHGIRKPAFFAYHFLSQLGGRLLLKGKGYIVTAKSENDFTAILFNYKYLNSRSRLLEQYRRISGNIANYLEDTEPCVFSLEIGNIAPGRYKVRQHILNSRHGSVYDAWMGLSAVEDLHGSETAWLERTCVPDLKIDFFEGKGNPASLAVECELEPNEVRLLKISLVLE